MGLAMARGSHGIDAKQASKGRAFKRSCASIADSRHRSQSPVCRRHASEIAQKPSAKPRQNKRLRPVLVSHLPHRRLGFWPTFRPAASSATVVRMVFIHARLQHIAAQRGLLNSPVHPERHTPRKQLADAIARW
jgi:hypothetical protein